MGGSSIAVGAVIDGVGFAGGLKPVAAAAFFVLFVGFASVASGLLRRSEVVDEVDRSRERLGSLP